MSIQHHKVHYRHLHHALNGLHSIIQSNDNEYDNVIDLISEIMGIYVLILKKLQSFAIEKLKKDRARYFDLVWYQIIYLSTLRVIENERDEYIDIDIENIHNDFMSKLIKYYLIQIV